MQILHILLYIYTRLQPRSMFVIAEYLGEVSRKRCPVKTQKRMFSDTKVRRSGFSDMSDANDALLVSDF